MKVFLLTISYPPVLNSAARLFSELATGLKEKGYQVTVITTIPQRYVADGEKDFRKKENLNGIEIYRLPMVPLPKHVPLFRGFEHFFVAFQCWLKGRHLPHHDAVIVYSPPLPLAITGIELARRWNGISIINVQDLYPQSVIDLGLLRNRFLVSLARWMERWGYQHANFITVHSEGNRKYVVEHGADQGRVHVVPNWVDLEKYSPGPRLNSFRKIYGLNDDFVVSYAGVMGFAQGVGDILEAAVFLKDAAPQIHFVLAGSGIALPRLKEWAWKENLSNVHFLPHLLEQEYIELLQASDVCLVTLIKDLRTPVVPGKLPCIMAVGRPVVCSTAAESDARRIVEEAKCGLWVDAGNTKALADAILRLYHDRTQREKMGSNGRTYAGTHFRRESCMEEYVKILGGFDK